MRCFLPAGEFARPGVFALVQADALQEAVGLRFHLGARAFLRLERAEEDVVHHAQMVKQFIALEHHADVLPRRVPTDVAPQHAVALQGNRATLDGRPGR